MGAELKLMIKSNLQLYQVMMLLCGGVRKGGKRLLRQHNLIEPAHTYANATKWHKIFYGRSGSAFHIKYMGVLRWPVV